MALRHIVAPGRKAASAWSRLSIPISTRGLKVRANALRVGNIVELEGDRLCMVKKLQHVKPGKGAAYVQADLNDLRSRSNTKERFRAAQDGG